MSGAAPAFPEPDFVVFPRGTPQFTQAWDGLRTLGYLCPPLLDGDPCPACHEGECWQYMGSTPTLHQFRHRAYPLSDGTSRRLYVNVTRDDR